MAFRCIIILLRTLSFHVLYESTLHQLPSILAITLPSPMCPETK